MLADAVDGRPVFDRDAVLGHDLRGPDQVFGVVTPLSALQLTNDLVLPPSGNVVEGVAAKILLGATDRDPSPEGQAARTASSLKTLERVNAIPAEQRKIGDPAWNDFLLHDNEGEIRKSLRSFELVYRIGGEEFLVLLPGVALSAAVDMARPSRSGRANRI